MFSELDLIRVSEAPIPFVFVIVGQLKKVDNISLKRYNKNAEFSVFDILIKYL